MPYAPLVVCYNCRHVFPTASWWDSPFSDQLIMGWHDFCPKCGTELESPQSVEPVRDEGFEALRSIGMEYRSVSCVTPELDDARQALVENLDRVYALGWFPWALDWNLQETFKRGMHHGASTAIRSIYGSMIIGTWTAFESLAADAWAAAVNARPVQLGRKAVEVPPRARGGADVTAISPQRLYQIAMREGFDLAHKMGDIVREERRGEFNRLEGLRNHYHIAFGPAAADVFRRHDMLAEIELIRNVLAHRGGRIDERFVQRCKRRPRLARYRPGQEIYLDGPSVRDYVDATSRACTELLQFVDTWLTANPLAASPDE